MLFRPQYQIYSANVVNFKATIASQRMMSGTVGPASYPSPSSGCPTCRFLCVPTHLYALLTPNPFPVSESQCV